jgi:hypothetical protein
LSFQTLYDLPRALVHGTVKVQEQMVADVLTATAAATCLGVRGHSGGYGCIELGQNVRMFCTNVLEELRDTHRH